MLGALLILFVLPGTWLALEMYRAPVACEGPRGLILLERGREWHTLVPIHRRRLARLALVYWGLG